MDYDICIIGGGPAGYLAGIRAAQLGAKAAVIEMDQLGGVCTNRGCIPTKSLLEVAAPVLSSEKWTDMGIDIHYKLDLPSVFTRMNDVVGYIRSGIQALLNSNKVEVIKGRAQFIDRYTLKIDDRRTVRAGFVLIASGSSPSLPDIEGIHSDRVFSSDGLFTMKSVPESAVIIGGGAIGIEYATILKSFGAKKVVIVEFMDRLLPFMDPDIGLYEKELMEKLGIEVVLSQKATKILSSSARIVKMATQSSSGNEAAAGSFDAERIFVATGRKPNTEGLGLDAIGVSTTKGWVNVNRAMRSSVDNIYAAGDVNGMKLLAHAAFHQGIIAVENMLGAQKIFEPLLVPSVVYSRPPVAQVGMDERSAREAGIEVKTGVFELANSPMALVHGEPTGFVKIVSDKKYGRVLGASLAGESAYELIALFTSGMAGEITVDELRTAFFAHPSFSEAVAEAAWAVDGLAQHAIRKGTS